MVKFVQEALVGDNIKGLTKIQDNNICLCLALKILNKFISCNQKLSVLIESHAVQVLKLCFPKNGT